MKPWEVLNRRLVYSAPPYLQVSVEKVQLPDGRLVEDYHQIDFGAFTGIVAETDDGKILLLRQYRHGIRRIALGLPGGRIDPGEAPLASAQREFREETGYQAANWQILAEYDASSTYGLSQCHFFYARGLTQIAMPASGDLEQTELAFLDRAAVQKALFNGGFASIGDALPITLMLLKSSGP